MVSPMSDPTGGAERSVHGHLIGFPDGPNVDVRELDARSWEVLKAFTYLAQEDTYTVSAGEPTDFASVPRAFVWFIPSYGKYTKAAILHDHLCKLAEKGLFKRRDADGIFRQAMRVLGVPFLRRWIMWAAVRWGALFARNVRSAFAKDLWRVLLITIPVLVLLGPAALVVLITLLLWYVVEFLVWIPLEIAKQFKQKRNRAAKKVNPPTLSLKT
jgi:hypothetical protein